MSEENRQIYGEIMVPSFLSEEEFEKGYKSSVFYVSENYMEEYQKHLIAMSHITNIAKSYIYNNWKKVTDWSGLNVIIIHGQTGVATEYYNYVPSTISAKNSEIWDKIWSEMDEAAKERHNPIVSVDEVVLDPTDGDFSITINGGQEHWWIQDEAVIIIADYIEKFLKKENEKNNS